MDSNSPLDPVALERLFELGGAVFVRQMIDLFLDFVPQKLSAAQAAECRGDSLEIQKAIHPLKSSSGNVGAVDLQELATRIEELAQEQPAARLSPLLRQFEAEFERVRTQLEKEKERLKE